MKNDNDDLLIDETLEATTVKGRPILRRLGPVVGQAVWRKPLFHDFFAGIRLILNRGEDESENEALVAARKTARAVMARRAIAMGADAVVGTHFGLVSAGFTAVEVRCCGEAVILGNSDDSPLPQGSEA